MRLKSLFAAVLTAVSTALTLACGHASSDAAENLSKIHLPQGFKISIYADNIENPRAMALSPKGTLFVGTREADRVYAVVDANGDHVADKIHTIYGPGTLPDGSKFDMPAGVAFRDGALYVSSVSRVVRFDDIEAHLDHPPVPVVLPVEFPEKGHHGWKFIAFGPDGKLYVPQGAWCNVCPVPDDELFATITRMNPDGTGREVIAKGVRNTVGFDWHPQTHELWFTENGRDNLGEDIPGDELNRLSTPGQHFGFPYVHQGDTLDPEFGKGKKVEDYVAPAQVLGPHVAALGMRFYTGTMFPEAYRNQIFIAEHGSWNRREKSGYRVMLVRLQGNAVVSYEPFAEGWLEGDSFWGRPADVLVMPDGSLLVSDDRANVIYRITYGN
jgi:glucose/arabinose dehydrogenase